MKLDKPTGIILLLALLIMGLLFQHRKLDRRLTQLEERIEDAASSAEEARDYAEEARDYAEEASTNSFGNVCSECPEELRYR